MKWKYAAPFNKSTIKKVEAHFKVELPTDYKMLLPLINSAKPSLTTFDVPGYEGCDLDHFLDISDVISVSTSTERDRKDLISIARDSSGNQICYQIDNDDVSELVFWDSETDTITTCAKTLTAFIEMLH